LIPIQREKYSWYHNIPSTPEQGLEAGIAYLLIIKYNIDMTQKEVGKQFGVYEQVVRKWSLRIRRDPLYSDLFKEIMN